MKNIKEIFSIFKKKSCLTSQQQKCNETIQSWLKAMVLNNRNLKPYGSYKKVDIDRAIALAEYLISLSKKEQLEEIAKSFSYKTLEPIYSEQVSIFLDDAIRLLYKFYPQYSDNIKKEEEPKKIQPKERKDHSLERFVDAQERM